MIEAIDFHIPPRSNQIASPSASPAPHYNPTFFYSAAYGANKVFGYALDFSTGSLSSVTGSPLAVGSDPVSLASNGNFLFALDTGDDKMRIK